ncbi:DUF262 domain-containing protein [Mesorhizobium caraganae]|uniref:DUF262 domain-containing protein n=1 Tax=Mesorhizobium caraganae TaxID=483206 RepID=UPI00193A6597|nr:DUF262 domain-containing protein [Mesorhizobium caraganae]MBM2711051.1 DUF262 domain-containing protein [Mesorhizobium caraganae]
MTFRVTPMQVQTLVSWWDEQPDIDFDPVYQRKGHLWSKPQKQDLVDTVLNGFDIPKLYLADFTILDSALNEKKKKYAVIDGKQRLIALFGFFAGDFTLAKRFTFYEDPTLSLGGLSYEDLTSNYPKIARRYNNYALAMMSVVTDDEAKISELFLRLNTSKPLSGAEIRNAMLGDVPRLIRQIVEHPFWSKIGFSTLRGQDKNAAAKLLLLEHAGSAVDTKKKQLDELVTKANALSASEVSISDGDSNNLDEYAFDDDTDTEGVVGDLIEASAETENTNVERSAMRVLDTLSRLAPLFVTKDDVLRQAAQIPVVYWLGRELNPAQRQQFRPFLVNFNNQREKNRKLPLGDPSRDPELLDYEILTRTSNDQASIEGRYKIMRRRLFEFLK